MEHKWGDYRGWVYLYWAKLYESLFFIVIMLSHSVMSHSLWPRALWPAKLLCQWDFSGKNTGVGCPFLLQGMFLTQRFKPCLLHCRYILYYQETSWITIINFKRSYENTVSFVLLHVCRMLLHLSFKCLMSISLTLPCHLIFAPLWGPSLCWEYTPIFLLLWPPPSLTDSSSYSQGPCVCDLPWLHCSGVHASDLGSCVGCADCLYLLSLCLTILGCLILFPHKFMSPWRGQAVSFCEEPSTGLVIMNVCWMNVQTPSDGPRMFESVTLSLLLLGRVKWWWSVWSWCQAEPQVCTV